MLLIGILFYLPSFKYSNEGDAVGDKEDGDVGDDSNNDYKVNMDYHYDD